MKNIKNEIRILNNENGITLVALIITIIVLLILAVVTIQAVNGDGIFTHADKSAKSYQIEAEKEAIKLALSEWKTKKYENSVNQTFSQYMQERFNNMNGYNCIEIDANTVNLTGPSKSQYRIKEDGTIEKVDPGIILSQTTITLLEGQTSTIEVTLVGGLEGKITFTSSDPSTITVTDAGVVAIAENPSGIEAIITITCSGHTAECKVYIANQGDFTYGYYNNTNKTVSVTGLSSAGEEKIADAVTTLVMPDKIIYNNEEYTITKISAEAFSGCTNLNLLSLPNRITSIERTAFSGCTNLTLTELPSGIENIPNNAFGNCKNLALTELPSGITSIGNGAFSGCTNLALTKLPSGITDIGYNAFSRCTNLTLTELPSEITNIGQYAFSECTNLALTSLPAGITSIEGSTFSECTNLALTSLPAGITSIKNMAFQNCPNITLSKLPDGVTSIGDAAFSGCTKLALTELPSGLTNIKNGTFKDCQNLALTSLPNGITSIGANAFSNCINLELTRLPRELTNVGGSAFYGCTKLVTLVIYDNLSNIGNFGFWGCNNLNTINYTGTYQEWTSITKGSSALRSATAINYNYVDEI